MGPDDNISGNFRERKWEGAKHNLSQSERETSRGDSQSVTSQEPPSKTWALIRTVRNIVKPDKWVHSQVGFRGSNA